MMKIEPVLIKKLKSYHWPGNIRELQHSVEKAVILNEGKIINDHRFFIQRDENISGPLDEPKTLEDMEKQMIQKSIEQNLGNLSKVAKELGITRATLYRKMDKYKI